MMLVMPVDLQEQEYYICIYTKRDADVILFHHEGGMDVGDIDSKVSAFYKWFHKRCNPTKIENLSRLMKFE